MVVPLLSQKSASAFSVSDNTSLTYSALLSETNLIDPGKAAVVSMRVSMVFYCFSPFNSCHLFDFIQIYRPIIRK